MSKDSSDPPSKEEITPAKKPPPEPQKRRKRSFGRSKEEKSKDPKARWGKAITGVRAVGKVKYFS